MDDAAQLALTLHTINAIQFGKFKLKSGMLAPIYLDLHLLASHPSVLRATARALVQILSKLKFDCIAAIPYAALPLGAAVALEMDRPLIYPRREKKEYGVGHPVEGEFKRGETVVLLDDIITTGAIKAQALEPLAAEGLIVRDIVVVIDHEQGGAEELAARGYRVHAVLKISQVMRLLRDAGKVTESQYQEVLTFLARKERQP